MTYSQTQRIVLALLPKTTGFVSVLSSFLIVCSVLRDPVKTSKPYHRLLLGMSMVDMLVSFSEALSTWPMPSDSGAMFASGSPTACSVQGFFVQTYICSSFYSVSLAIYYTVVLRYSWSETKVLKLEPYLHSVPLLWGVGTGIIGIPLKLYNPAGFWCWMAPYPSGCVGDECIRGANANLFRWAFFYGPLWCNVFFVTAAMAMVWCDVRKTTTTVRSSLTARQSLTMGGGLSSLLSISSSHAKHPSPNQFTEEQEETMDEKELFLLGYEDKTLAEREWLTQKIKRDVAFQGFLYSGSFYITWIWLTSVRFLQLIGEPVPYPLIATAAFFAPLQGFFNVLIYMYPKYKAIKETNPKAGVLHWIYYALKA